MSKHKQAYWPHSEPEAEEPPTFPCVGHHPDTAAPAETGRLCADCYKRLRGQIRRLPAVVSWLHAHIAAGGSAWAGEQRVSGSREQRIPLRLDVMDLIGPTIGDDIPDCADDDRLGRGETGEMSASIIDEITSWVRTVAEQQPADPPKPDLHSMCTWLLERTRWIAAQEWVSEFLTALHQLYRDAGRIAPWHDEHLRDRQEPCGDCGVLALVQHVAEGRVVCETRLGGCGRGRAVTKYEWNTRHLRSRPEKQAAS